MGSDEPATPARHRIAAVGSDPVACHLENRRRSNHPTHDVLLGQVAIQPVPTRPGFLPKVELLALTLPLVRQGVDILLPGAYGTQRDDFRSTPLGDIRDLDCFLVDIHSNEKDASLRHD